MGRILGLDPGERRIGAALSDPTGTIASPHAVIDRRAEDAGARILAICTEYDVTRIVVGLPVTLAGTEGRSAEMARDVAVMASRATGLPVDLHDERFTSTTAEVALREGGLRREERREVRDKVAAAVLLQGYLDAVRASGDADGSGTDGGTTP